MSAPTSFGTTFRQDACGCTVDGIGNLKDPWRPVRCAQHDAGPQLLRENAGLVARLAELEATLAASEEIATLANAAVVEANNRLQGVTMERDRALAQRDALRDCLEAVLPYAAQFWRSGEQPASCMAEARAAIAAWRGGARRSTARGAFRRCGSWRSHEGSTP